MEAITTFILSAARIICAVTVGIIVFHLTFHRFVSPFAYVVSLFSIINDTVNNQGIGKEGLWVRE